MLRADVGNRTSTIESPNFNVSVLGFGQVSREYERLTFRPAELQISQHKNNAPHVRYCRGGTAWPPHFSQRIFFVEWDGHYRDFATDYTD